MISALSSSQRIVVIVAVALSLVAAGATAFTSSYIAQFVLAGLALAALAALVGQAIEQVGERLGPGPTGLLQSALGNLPELFVGIFALRAGLPNVVRSALVGSILSNAVLVLGMAFLVGGIRHGTQRFNAESARMIGTMLCLAVAALLIPTLAAKLGTPAKHHTVGLSNACALVLLIVYAASIPFWLRGGPTALEDAPTTISVSPEHSSAEHSGPEHSRPEHSGPAHSGHSGPSQSEPANPAWPLRLAIGLLALGSLGAAFVSDWFVSALQPATRSLGLSQTFTGLVVVAIASNAVENAVGIRFAMKARPDYVLSTILNSPLQVALLLTPVLVLASQFIGPSHLTLVFPPLLVAVLAVATVVVVVVVYDGEYTWLEGVALIGLYAITVSAFWWG